VEHLPNIKSQKDRVKTNKVETLRNKSVKSELRTELKKAESAVETDKAAAVNAAFSAIDIAVRKGVLSKNAANRKKAKFAKRAAN